MMIFVPWDKGFSIEIEDVVIKAVNTENTSTYQSHFDLLKGKDIYISKSL